MIHYKLRCPGEHVFDGWFKDSAAFDAQADRRLITCPECGDSKVTRALMAPAIPRKQRDQPSKEVEILPPAAPVPPAGEMTAAGLPDQVRAVLQRIRAEVERTSDYVGPNFAAEARRIHRGESDKRSIYGESTPEQAEALADEGIEVARIPWVPRADG
ncbi:MAG: DUF1178 family protein [Acetobacteraceae bacterium]|nr:DUF1178 family protein [Acetobacteraceae bacterium]